jgi:hypothetical protein
MTLKFWDEAFLTSTYLMNILPSRTINNDTARYSSLRVFRSACWPNLLPYNTRKLAFYSTQCIILGYSPRHKGLKCLEVSSGRVYISRDVVFDEAVFSFKLLHPNAGALLRQEILLLPPTLLNTEQGDEFIDDINMTNVPTNPASSLPFVAPQGCPSLMPQTGENSVQNHPQNDVHTNSEEDGRTGHDVDALMHLSGSSPRSASDLPPGSADTAVGSTARNARMPSATMARNAPTPSGSPAPDGTMAGSCAPGTSTARTSTKHLATPEATRSSRLMSAPNVDSLVTEDDIAGALDLLHRVFLIMSMCRVLLCNLW